MTHQQRRRRGRIALLVALAAGIAVIDQVTKYLAEANLTQGVIVPLVGDLLGLQLIYNPGAAFSFATGMTWVFTVITIVVVVVVARVARRLRSTVWAVALGLLLGGALGNLYDRLLREPGFARGHVVDFINYNGWFVGNVADIAIVAAAVLIALLALIGIEIDGTRASDEHAASDGAVEDDDEDVSEEPLAAEDEFTPDVPRASGDGVDVAGWVADAPSASEAPAPVLAADDDASAGEPSASSEPDGWSPEPAAGTAATSKPAWAPTGAAGRAGTDAAEPAAPATAGPAGTDAAEPAAPGTVGSPGDAAPAETAPPPRRRPRSRREARLAADDDA